MDPKSIQRGRKRGGKKDLCPSFLSPFFLFRLISFSLRLLSFLHTTTLQPCRDVLLARVSPSKCMLPLRLISARLPSLLRRLLPLAALLPVRPQTRALPQRSHSYRPPRSPHQVGHCSGLADLSSPACRHRPPADLPPYPRTCLGKIRPGQTESPSG